MNQVCEFVKDYIHLNFNKDYSTLIEEKENIWMKVNLIFIQIDVEKIPQ